MCHGQLLSDAILKARKVHRCNWCRQEILPGQLYQRVTGIIDGEMRHGKSCRRCWIKLQIVGHEDADAVCYVEPGSDDELREIARDRGVGWLAATWREYRARWNSRKAGGSWLVA